MSSQHQRSAYVEAVEIERRAKDRFFATSPHTPIEANDRPGFRGLAYYPVDPAYRLGALRLERYEGGGPERFAIPTSDGALRPARRAGSFRFELGGVACRLSAYVLDEGDPEAMFVPFLDGTSGSDTYGAGRYLDLEPEPDGSYTLDFNLAYAPYCAYSPYFSCPLTPEENRLPVRVEAGERLPEGASPH